MHETIIAICGVIALIIVYKIICRCGPHRPGSGNDPDGDSGVKERIRDVEEQLDRCEESADRGSEHLGNAEEILKGAIERSRKKRESVESGRGDN